jgi:hypothetical protein
MRLRAAACAILFSSLAFGQAQEGVAQARFNKGRELFIKEAFAPALVEFRAASELYESPNTRLYIARCERALGHVAAAYVEFRRAANEAADRARTDPRYASTHDVAAQEGAALESKLAHVTIVARSGLPDSVTITINGAAFGQASLGVGAPVDPGPIDVVARAPGYVTVHKNVGATAGEAVEVELKLERAASEAPTANDEKPPEDEPVHETPHTSHSLRNAGWVVGGIGVAGMGVCATFFALAQARFDQLKSQCSGPCDASYTSQVNEGQTFQTIGNVALAAGGTAIVTGVIMIIAGSTRSSPPPVQAAFTPLASGGWLAGVVHTF